MDNRKRIGGKMNVLSCFDGMSCGQIALNRIGIKPVKYYAAEIDKHAIQVTQHNYPGTIQLGSVLDWKGWGIDWASIDLVTGGFPCQAWSVAGKGLGDKDPRGALFWTFLDIIKNVMLHNSNAKFLMENVKMKKEFEKYITHHTEQALGTVHKTLINSALVSAQSRQRYYWTNFAVTQPADRGIILADILESEVSDIFITPTPINHDGGNQLNPDYKSQANTIHSVDSKSPTICAGTHGYALGYVPMLQPCKPREYDVNAQLHHAADATDTKIVNYYSSRVYAETGKAPTLRAAGHTPKILCGAIRGRYIVDGKRQDHKMKTAGLTEQRLEVRQDGKTNTLTTVQKDNVVVYSDLCYRKLTPVECERLQTVPDNFTDCVSNTQRYKMIGNGWTVDVIAHILGQM
jgi:DNA-cytosine methyltransferase